MIAAVYAWSVVLDLGYQVGSATGKKGRHRKWIMGEDVGRAS